MHHSRRFKIWMVLLVVFLAGLTALGVHFATSDLDHNDRLASTVGVFVAALALVLAAVPEVRRSRDLREPSGTAAGEPMPRAELLDKAAALSAVLESFWTQEAADRGLRNPAPINVHWRTTTRDVLGDVRELLGGHLDAAPKRLRAEGDLGDALDRLLALPRRRLVVLGAAGSGKTSFAVVLLLGILKRRGRDEPVPYLVPVASWNPRRERLRTWLVRRLAQDHYDGNRRIPAALLAAGLILPVLDGLDEIAPELQSRAVDRVRTELGAGAPLIITSLADEYERAVDTAGTAVENAVVVELQPLSAEQIIDYFRQDGAPRPRWSPLIRVLAADPGGTAAAALSTPLAVSLARTVYSRPEHSPGDLVRLATSATPGAMEDRILDAVIPAAFGTDRAPSVLRSFTFLAKVLDRTGNPTIEWWRLTTALPRYVPGIVIFLTGVVTASLMSFRGTDGWPMLAVVFGWIGGVAAMLAENPTPVAGEIRVRGRVAHLLGRVVRAFAAGIALSIALSLPFGILFAAQYAITRDPGVRLWVAQGTTWGGYGPALAVGVTFGLVVGGIIGAAVAMIVGLARGVRQGARTGGSVASWLFTGCVAITLPLDEVPDRRSIVDGLAPPDEERTSPVAGSAVQAFADGLTTTEVSEGVLRHLLFPVPLLAVTFGLLGLVFGVVAATRAAARAPIDVRRLASPLDAWRADRRAAATQIVAVFGAVAVTWLGLTAVLSGGRPDVVSVLLFAAGCSVYPVCFTAWFRFQITRAYFSVVRGLPWDLFGLLEAGHQRQVLRQVGSGYQFRHGKLQERLARS